MNIKNFFRAEIRLSWPLAFSIAIVMALGAWRGSLVSYQFSGHSLKVFVASLLAFNSVTTLFKRTREDHPFPQLGIFRFMTSYLLILADGMFSGMTGLSGVGLALRLSYQLF